MPALDSTELKKRFPSPRLIQIEELPAVVDLFESVRAELADRGLDLWQHGYPDESQIQADITSGCMWGIGSDDGLFGAVTLNHDASPEYDDVEWGWEAKHPLVIHRLGVHRDFQSKGYGSYLLDFCERKASQLACDAIRLDTYMANRRNMRFYQNRGYNQAKGEMRFPPHKHAFAGFEKRPGA